MIFLRAAPLLAGLLATVAAAEPAGTLQEAKTAEERYDCSKALQLYLQAEKEDPTSAFILQKIARQYSDLVPAQTSDEQKRAFAAKALEYSEKAVALDPNNAVSVLSLAVSHGKLALYSDVRTEVKYIRLVHDEAQEAIRLDPNYAWAHEVLGRWNYEVASLGPTARFFVRVLFGGFPPASHADAVRETKLATQLEPDELCHWLELGFAYSAAGDSAQARKAWEHGLAMPSHRIYHEPAKERARAALAKLP